MTTLDWTPPAPQRASGTGWLVGAILGSQIVSGMVFVAFDPSVRQALLGEHPGQLRIDGVALAMGLLAAWLVLLAASYWWAAYDAQTSQWPTVRATLGWRPCTRRHLIWAAALAVAVVAIGDGGDALASALGAAKNTNTASVLGDVAGEAGIGLILLGGIVAPFVEETFFRGALLGALTRRYSPGKATAISAAIFAVLHIGGFGVIGVLNLAVVAASGVALAALRIRSGSLLPGAAAHVAINLAGLIAVKA